MSAVDACAIGIGAVCGAISRYQVGRIAAEKVAQNERFQALVSSGWHTAGINIVGSFALGTITAIPTNTSIQNKGAGRKLSDVFTNNAVHPMKQVMDIKTVSSSSALGLKFPNRSNFHLSPRTKLLLGVGFCGSFTTFSTYSVDIVNMLNRGETMKALQYGMANNVGGILAVFAAHTIVKKLLRV